MVKSHILILNFSHKVAHKLLLQFMHCISVSVCLQYSTTTPTLPWSWTSGNSTPGMTWVQLRIYFIRCLTVSCEGCLRLPVHTGLSHPFPTIRLLPHQLALLMEGSMLRLCKVVALPKARQLPALPRLSWPHLLKERSRKRGSVRPPSAPSPVRPYHHQRRQRRS